MPDSTNIPEDICEKAEEVWRAMGFVNDRLNQTPVLAAALLAERMAERARCAEIAEMHSASTIATKDDGDKSAVRLAARSIAFLIRRQDEVAAIIREQNP